MKYLNLLLIPLATYILYTQVSFEIALLFVIVVGTSLIFLNLEEIVAILKYQDKND